MKVTMLGACDAVVAGEAKALHAGQQYDLPDDVAKGLIAQGTAEKYKAPSAPKEAAAEPAEEDKQADETPENKAPKRRDSRRSTIQRGRGSR